MRTTNGLLFTLLCIIILLSVFVVSNVALDTLFMNQTLTDGKTVVSSGGKFELGFFSPGKSKNRYVGIWYKDLNVKTAVWVANRENPLTDSSGSLKVTQAGVLVVLNSTSQVIWSSNASSSVRNPMAQLLDTGNLVIKNMGEENPVNFLWQSFDYPGNTLLEGMKLGKNFVTGQEWKLTSWKSEDDPSQGDFTYMMDTHGYPEMLILNRGNVSYRSGPWVGDGFSGQPKLDKKSDFQYEFMFTNVEAKYSVVAIYVPSLPRRVLYPMGVMLWLTWSEKQANWETYVSGPPRDACDTYATCGAYGWCNVENNPLCVCLDKFVAKFQTDYDTGSWSNGCERKIPLNCAQGDKFLKYSELRLPITTNAWFNASMNLEECRVRCLTNCSCTAYSSMKSDDGSGCFLWFEELVNMRSLAHGDDIFIRIASSESDSVSLASSDRNKRDMIVGVAISVAVLLLCLSLALFLLKRKLCNSAKTGDLDLPLFDLAKIINATNNFSLNNKIGEGGYGTVYKASLEEGQEVAVKRLSKDSSQGLDEFINETTFIAKLQHRNLVKLLGCCIQAEEKMLIYEYMPNKSLDYFLFDETRSSILDWPTRFHIINGISRGINYLHEDSRLRIIHRDLKASNVLLDIDMNPKIADFGMARSFGGNETSGNTKRVVGTYGYMSPEYQLHGRFSVKSDVFSFGVLVMEIICGMRNRGFYHPNHEFNLLGHAWTLYNEGKSLELIDTYTIESCHLYETLRCIHVALLCAQQSPEDRPTMSDVVIMLGGDSELPRPKQPGFFTGKSPLEDAPTLSINGLTITHLDPR